MPTVSAPPPRVNATRGKLLAGVGLAVLLACALVSAAVAANITGTSRADVLRGTPKADVILGRGGNDRIYGLGGNDRIVPGAGTDRVFCGAGRDRVTADAVDIVARDCEVVTRPKTPAPAPPPPAPQPPAPTPPPTPSPTDIVPGNYQGATNTGDHVFFEVLANRTMRGFRVNDMEEKCDGPLIIFGPIDLGPTPVPLGADGSFLIEFAVDGTIDDLPAKFTVKVAGRVQGSAGSGTAVLGSEFDYEDRHWICSTGEKTWTANRVG
jgi:hypothetical protein